MLVRQRPFYRPCSPQPRVSHHRCPPHLSHGCNAPAPPPPHLTVPHSFRRPEAISLAPAAVQVACTPYARSSSLPSAPAPLCPVEPAGIEFLPCLCPRRPSWPIQMSNVTSCSHLPSGRWSPSLRTFPDHHSPCRAGSSPKYAFSPPPSVDRTPPPRSRRLRQTPRRPSPH